MIRKSVTVDVYVLILLFGKKQFHAKSITTFHCHHKYIDVCMGDRSIKRQEIEGFVSNCEKSGSILCNSLISNNVIASPLPSISRMQKNTLPIPSR